MRTMACLVCCLTFHDLVNFLCLRLVVQFGQITLDRVYAVSREPNRPLARLCIGNHIFMDLFQKQMMLRVVAVNSLTLRFKLAMQEALPPNHIGHQRGRAAQSPLFMIVAGHYTLFRDQEGILMLSLSAFLFYPYLISYSKLHSINTIVSPILNDPLKIASDRLQRSPSRAPFPPFGGYNSRETLVATPPTSTSNRPLLSLPHVCHCPF
jgi:hypothetical protein